jgi:hyperosmotically inducible protein
MRARIGLLVFLSATTLAGVMTIFIAGCNKPQEAAGTPPPSTTVGTELDDSVVTARVKSALLADPDVKSFGFKVETRKGEVQLSGFVDNQTLIDRAIAVTRGVAGVKSIDNKVSLKGAATTVGNKVDDGIVTTKVKAALLADAYVKSFDIAAVTRKGEVQLSGFVDNQSQIDRAIEVAHGIEGVRSVSNEMSIKK